MGKRPLSEKFVQSAVAERLNRDYYRRKSAYVNTEVYTRLKRADVLLAFMRARKRPYVVVVEAKSRTTIHQLKLKENPDRLRWTGRIVTLLLIVGLSAVLGYQWYFNALNTLLLLGLFVLASSLITSLIGQLELSALAAVGAIEQLARYPANEKWIAIGEDSIVKDGQYQQLRRQCRKNGIGLIVVSKTGKLRLREIPRPRHVFNNYLDSYGKEATILKTIDRRPDYGPTPPERRKFRRQLLNAALLVGIVSLLGLVAYEENNAPVVPDPFQDDYTYEARQPAEDSAPPTFPDTAAEERQGADAGSGGKDEAAGCDPPLVSARSFIVVDALLNERRTEERLAELTAAGIPNVSVVPTECLNSWPSPGRQAIYIGSVYPDRPTARAAAARYRELLEERGLDVGYGKPVKVRPQ